MLPVYKMIFILNKTGKHNISVFAGDHIEVLTSLLLIAKTPYRVSHAVFRLNTNATYLVETDTLVLVI